MKKVLVILNPAARGERARSLREKIQALSLRTVVRMTSGPGDAREMAAKAVEEGFATIVAAGGDGTVNEVANGVAGSGAGGVPEASRSRQQRKDRVASA